MCFGLIRSPGMRLICFLSDELLHHGQITDTYLLALAVHHEGVLISFDQRLRPRSVRGGTAVLQLIQPESS